MFAPYFAIIIPVLGAIGLYVFFKARMAWWEFLIPIAVSLIFIFTYKLISQSVATSDIEYRGAVIPEARYYEYWETWETKTCTEEYACGTNSKGETQYCTRTYDCSYCDYNDAYWQVVDEEGNTYNISNASGRPPR